MLQLVEQGIRHDLRMKRGNIKENDNLNKIQKSTGKVIQQRNSKLYQKQLSSNRYILFGSSRKS